MAGKKKGGHAARTAAGSKTQRQWGPCSDCGDVVEVQRVQVIGTKSYKTWWCKAEKHESIAADKIYTDTTKRT